MNLLPFHTRIFRAAASASLLFGCQREWWGVSTLQVSSFSSQSIFYHRTERRRQTEKQTTSKAITLPAEKREVRKRQAGGDGRTEQAAGRGIGTSGVHHLTNKLELLEFDLLKCNKTKMAPSTDYAEEGR